jgi:putative transposase
VQVLWDLAEKCRLIYNFALAARKTEWQQNQKLPTDERRYLSYYDQSKRLPELKKKYPEYTWVYSKVLQHTLKKLNFAFKSFFSKWNHGDKEARAPQFRGKNHFFTLYYLQSGFNIAKNSIIFSHKHPSKVPLLFELKWHYRGTNKIKLIEILRDQKNRWFVSITYDVKSPAYFDNGLYFAVDLGISNLISGVNLGLRTLQIKNRRPDLYWKMKIAEVQSKRDHCKGSKLGHKKSRRWLKYNRKLYSMKRKCANQMHDFQHFIAKNIVKNTKANTIIIGDLPVKGMSKKKKETGNSRKTKVNKTLNYSMQNTGTLGRFAQFLTYKAEMIGKRVVRIDERGTTQTCCVCGTQKKRVLSERKIVCDCGNVLDRDINAAINIMKRFVRNKHDYAGKYGFLSPESPMNGESFLNKLNLLRYTAPSKPKVEMADS